MQHKLIKGLGAQINPSNRFDKIVRDITHYVKGKTQYQNVYPKTIVNKVNSPDVGMDYSLNPYQGCEHGCVYCYARPTHNYWGYSAGTDFERKILVKRNAPKLLSEFLSKKKWEGHSIAMSGNTDCYQPIEKEEEITRKLLFTFERFKNPTGIVTKNSLILRDMDVLKELNKYNLIRVAISLSTLDEDIRQKLEPRTASAQKRIKVIETLAKESIPVMVLAAPIIPSINDKHIFELVKIAAESGAYCISPIVVRLNGDVRTIFENWLETTMPDRKDKVIHKIEDLHGGVTNDSRFGKRMKGEGKYSEIIKQQFEIARNKYTFADPPLSASNKYYMQLKNPQLSMF
jgi:DNA repair photolyase